MHSIVLAGALLVAGVAGAEGQHKAIARTSGMTGFFTTSKVPFGEQYAIGDGELWMEADGAKARVLARFSVDGDNWKIELKKPAAGRRPAFDTEVEYGKMRVPAAVAVWGRGVVYKNGQKVADDAAISAVAFSEGIHAD